MNLSISNVLTICNVSGARIGKMPKKKTLGKWNDLEKSENSRYTLWEHLNKLDILCKVTVSVSRRGISECLQEHSLVCRWRWNVRLHFVSARECRELAEYWLRGRKWILGVFFLDMNYRPFMPLPLGGQIFWYLHKEFTNIWIYTFLIFVLE